MYQVGKVKYQVTIIKFPKKCRRENYTLEMSENVKFLLEVVFL